jgi:hypothetical protein
MPFYQKLNLTFIEIPSNAGTAINYSLLKKEYDLEFAPIREYRKILFDSNFQRKSIYKVCPWWMIAYDYPQSINSNITFAIVRNPFDRMISIFHNFTKFREKYLKYRLSEDDTKKDIQNKFDNFIKEYHAWRNMAAGAGLNLIEILSRKNPVITKDMYIENTKAIKDYYYYDQAYFLNKDFQKNKTIFSEILHRDCDVIKYENLNLIYQKYPNIFTEKIVYENFDKLKNGKSQLNRIPYQAYYSKYTKKFVQEHFEIDFYNFHYSFDFNLI